MYETTSSRIVTGEVAIWAVPEREYDGKVGDFIFTGEWAYELHTRKPFVEGAIKLQAFPVTLNLSSGLPFIEKAIETLENDVKDEMANHNLKMNKLQAQIQKLKLITHQKESDNGF